MFKTIRNAFKVKDIRNKLIFTFIALIIVRLGSWLPVPAISANFAGSWFDANTMGFLNALTGGSFTNMSIFALGITPYITSSIIMQLLTIAIPKLEEMQKEGEDGRKKIAEISRYVTVGLAIFEAVAIVIGFSASGYLEGGLTFTNVVMVVLSMTAGTAFLMWLGEKITEKGVGNGISIILLINIVSTMPNDFYVLYTQFIKGKPVVKSIIAALIIIGVVVLTVVLIIVLQDAQRKIPVQYAKKVQGRKMVGGQTSHIPLKVNTAGVIPVIFAGSLMQLPIVIASLFGVQGARASIGEKILYMLNSGNWLNTREPGEFKYSIGLIIYVVLLILFAYFYTSITFNPMEISNNMKKQGGFIPGIRPGKPSTEYLTKVLNYIVLVGAIGLAIVAVIPMFFAGVFNAKVTFGGTSLIIVVGVVLETMKQVESQLLVRHYKGFLND